MGDRYDELTGVELRDLLEQRQLPLTGKVDELRDRLREDDAKPVNDPPAEDEPEESETDDVEIPEPREPLRIQPYGVVLTKEQAQALNAGEARIRQFTKHVNPISDLKYAEGDQVMALGSPESTTVRVLPYGVEIELSHGAAEPEEG